MSSLKTDNITTLTLATLRVIRAGGLQLVEQARRKSQDTPDGLEAAADEERGGESMWR